MSDQILRLPQVINATGLPRSSLYAKIAEGEFPTPIKLSKRSVGWSSSQIDARIQERIAQQGEPHAED